jgi:integrase
MMVSDMVKVEMPGLVSDDDRHGNTRYYYRAGKGRKKVRIRAEVGSPEFHTAYTAAVAQSSQGPTPSIMAPKGSFSSLCAAYMASTKFKVEYAEESQKWRRRMLNSLCKTFGDKPFNKMEARHINEWVDARSDRPEAANNLVKCLRALYAFAIERDMTNIDPTAGVKKIRTYSDGFHTWTVTEVFQYLDTHGPGTRARTALYIALFTGLRRKDVASLGRQHITADGEFITLKAAKSRRKKLKDMTIPFLSVLRTEILDSAKGHMTFLRTAYGKPFTPAGLGGAFRIWCDKAGLKHCSIHGLRKAGATIAADNGATDRQLMAIYNWTKADMATIYTQQRDNKKLAIDGMKFLHIERPTNTESPTPEPEVSHRENIKTKSAS